jgi:branched-chain amino acid transport system permease protein
MSASSGQQPAELERLQRAEIAAHAHWRRGQVVQLLGFFAVAALVPAFVRNPYYLNVLAYAGINVIVATGLNLLMGYAGQVSLGHAGFFGLGAYTSAVLTTRYGWSPWTALPMGVALTCSVAYVVGVPTLRLRGHYLAMATLGLGIIIEILLRQSKTTGGASGIMGIPSFSLAGRALETDMQYYYFVWAFAAVLLVVFANLTDSRPGRALRALHESELAAGMLGVDTASYKVQAFAISAAFAAIGGSLHAHSSLHFVSPESFGFRTSIALVVMVVLGGEGTLWGPVFGAAAVTAIEERLRRYNDIDIVVYGLLLMVMMTLMPGGLSRAVAGLVERLRYRAVRGPAAEEATQ